MARPRTFDEDAVLDRAVEVFRKRGYEAVGVQQLVDDLGLNRSSIYGAFGSKHDLYLRALQRYRTSTWAPVFEVLADESRDPLERVRAVIDAWAAASGVGAAGGCLMVNAACELGGVDDTVRDAVCDQLGRTEAALAEVLTVARSIGRLSDDADPEVLSRFLVTVLQGAGVLRRVGDDVRPRAAFEVAHRVLDGVERSSA